MREWVSVSASLKNTYEALGFEGPVSFTRDILGFTGGMPGRLDATRAVPSLSLAAFVQGIRGTHFHVRLIIAGSDLLTTNDEDTIDYAVFRMREIYASNGMAIGVVSRTLLPAANSSGHATVSSEQDINDAGRDLTEDGDFVPVVLPANMLVTRTEPDGSVFQTLGLSPVPGPSPGPGPCTPRQESGMNSAVVDISGEETARTLAHEIGHYLGADHPATASTTLMTQTGSVPQPTDPFDAVAIVESDRTTIRGHCTMRAGLPV